MLFAHILARPCSSAYYEKLRKENRQDQAMRSHHTSLLPDFERTSEGNPRDKEEAEALVGIHVEHSSPEHVNKPEVQPVGEAEAPQKRG